MVDKMIANIAEKTGKTVEEWIVIVKASQLEKHGQIIKMLKTDHDFTHGYANLVAHMARESSAQSMDDGDLISDQYMGKESLKPIYDAIMKEVNSFGSDVEVAPKKVYVSLRRKKQFALIQPSTKTRVDVGINIKGKPEEGALLLAGSWNGMVSHRVKLASKDDVTADLIGWIKEAYDNAG